MRFLHVDAFISAFKRVFIQVFKWSKGKVVIDRKRYCYEKMYLKSLQ